MEVLYSKTKAESELLAQRFVDEPIIGFDMEWPWNASVKNTLQNKIGLIQIASEDKVGLFHIGLHPGRTSVDIIAPSLKKIIEDPGIGKVGVHILGADFSRLSRFFGLEPKGAIELSHLYRLVKFGPCKPEFVSVRLVNLAQQVQDQLGLPLNKGDVRTSNWSRPLTSEQIDYSAGDAYAGFMLYHCMNAQRLAMTPTPPPPIFAERYPSIKASRDDPILLDVGDGSTITTEEFFGVKPVKIGLASTASTGATRSATSKTITGSLDGPAKALFDALLVRRALLAKKGGVPPTRILSDTLVQAIARACPRDTQALVAIRGIGKFQQQKYGDEWLEVISLSLTKKGLDQASNAAEASASKGQVRDFKGASPPSSPAFDPIVQPPQLHTGLSFSLADASIDADDPASHEKAPGNTSEGTLPPSLPSGLGSGRRVNSRSKRKRSQSPTEQQTVTPDSHRQTQTTAQPLAQPTAAPQSRKPPAAFNAATSTSTSSTAPASAAPSSTTTTPHTTSTVLPSHEPSLSHALSIAHTSRTTRPSSTSASTSKPSNRFAKSKLLALSKLVASKLPQPLPPGAPPLLTPYTLELIVQTRPQTVDELKRIPGIESFFLACQRTGTDLLKNIIKFLGDEPGR